MQSRSASKKTSIRSPENNGANQFEGMLGVSLPMLEVFQSIMDAASADVPVLITERPERVRTLSPERFTIEADGKINLSLP